MKKKIRYTLKMQKLINIIVQECKEQSIKTKTPNEIEKLKALWSDAE